MNTAKFFDLVNFSNKILIINSKPDGDSIGASIALNLLLKKENKDVTSMSPAVIPDYLGFLVNRGPIKIVDVEKENFEEYDLVILVDASDLNRAINNKVITWNKKAKFVCIDHHEQSEEGIVFIYDLSLTDTKYESTCGIITDIFKESKKEQIDTDIAFLLYSGIVSDTDYFGYSNATKETFERAAFLMSYEFDNTQIIKVFRETLTLNAFRFIQRFIGKVVVNPEKRYAYLKIKKEDLTPEENVLIINEASNFLNRAIIRIIDCVDFSFVLRESNENKTSLAMRRHNNGNDVDLSLIAGKFGGGGHKQAAGAQVEKNIDQVEKEIVEFLEGN